LSYSLTGTGFTEGTEGRYFFGAVAGIYRGRSTIGKMLTKSNLAVKPYQSNDTELSALFEQRVFREVIRR
jgi:alpha-acetolactate decarboxylase